MTTPKVRLAHPKGRPIQIRYTDPETKKEVRISTGTHDFDEAEDQKRKIEAKLLLGIEAKPEQKYGPTMSWEIFREEYSTRYLSTLRDRARQTAESRLDIIERVLKPVLLSDVANYDALETLQAELLRGAESRYNAPRSAHTVKGYMAATLAALNWAASESRGWIDRVPKVKVKTSKLRAAKGRPLKDDEFQEMLNVTAIVVGSQVAHSWRFLLRGLRASGLRLSEIMNVHWTDPNLIMPVFGAQYSLLQIPAQMQKNNTDESIPLVPWFENVLQEVPECERTGYVFNPQPVVHKCGRPATGERLESEWVGKVISRIGKQAGIVVHPGDKKTGRKPKFASAHDLRRTCSQQMIDAGVPEMLLQRVMRHASFETTKRHYSQHNLQRECHVLKTYLGTVDASE